MKICGYKLCGLEVPTHRSYCSKSCQLKHSVFKRRRKVKLMCIIYKGGKCEICGYCKCTSALDFHHFRGEKKFNISDSHNKSWKSIKEELDKCLMVCSNCHREEHHDSSVDSMFSLDYLKKCVDSDNGYPCRNSPV